LRPSSPLTPEKPSYDYGGLRTRGGENGLKTAQRFRVASAGSAEWMLLGYVGIAHGRRGVEVRVSLSAVPANAAALEASVTACHGQHRREVRW
jgi:hypothetical protein